jgi:hypothetical protein
MLNVEVYAVSPFTVTLHALRSPTLAEKLDVESSMLNVER